MPVCWALLQNAFHSRSFQHQLSLSLNVWPILNINTKELEHPRHSKRKVGYVSQCWTIWQRDILLRFWRETLVQNVPLLQAVGMQSSKIFNVHKWRGMLGKLTSQWSLGGARGFDDWGSLSGSTASILPLHCNQWEDSVIESPPSEAWYHQKTHPSPAVWYAVQVSTAAFSAAVLPLQSPSGSNLSARYCTHAVPSNTTTSSLVSGSWSLKAGTYRSGWIL